ncbi:Tryptophan synthase alpha chain [Thermobacillus xylanilyticus]|uniref:Tryptophan synthase alpha chain n=2 Tax=Thermobacillus TaxID=76632 RepID=L0EE63_THECK|nr:MULTISPECIES: tryptophan synthase subunit alpha [Thermobacillus]AGA57971.1 tryptophan synthase, alpha subunit [Thermobacillus composti KWC4]CAG5086978.1 Tryptophan synthase alpha chain [Thermobacillus xylanilyticus]
MNRIDATFERLRREGKSALIPFLTIGDPDLAASAELIAACAAAGADMIELGVPYSDPLADGPVIQRASERALQNRVTLEDVVRTAAEARRLGADIPYILFSYYNPVLQYGLDRFFKLLEEHDISGLIVPDLPLEEDGELRDRAEAAGIHLIPLVAPTSHERIARITARARGFVYCVSSLGVTGMRSEFHASIDDFLASVRSASPVPICVGFGISNREQVLRFEGKTDGVIVGSAIVRKIEEALPLLGDSGKRAEGVRQVEQFIRSLRV